MTEESEEMLFRKVSELVHEKLRLIELIRRALAYVPHKARLYAELLEAQSPSHQDSEEK